MSETDEKLKWSTELFEEYFSLHEKHYQTAQGLWPDNKKVAPDIYCRFVELEQFFRPLNNTRMLLEELARRKNTLEKSNKLVSRYREALECAQEVFEIEGITCIQVDAALREPK